jgi:ADP-ribose pyrophosphatase YjhB (NUDIX family)
VTIRLLAVGLFRVADRILVAEGTEPESGARFYRPLGGGVEFGERAEAALRREIREELGAEVATVRQVGVLENLFVYAGRPRHEVVFVFDATFADAALYARPELPVTELGAGWGPAHWRPLAELASGAARLVPAGLLERVAADAAGAAGTPGDGAWPVGPPPAPSSRAAPAPVE